MYRKPVVGFGELLCLIATTTRSGHGVVQCLKKFVSKACVRNIGYTALSTGK